MILHQISYAARIAIPILLAQVLAAAVSVVSVEVAASRQRQIRVLASDGDRSVSCESRWWWK